MSDIKAGELAAIRTTGETVFVLGINKQESGYTNVSIRRPNMTNDGGMMHLVETFTLAELETLDSMRARRLADSYAMQQQVFGLKQQIKETEDESTGQSFLS